jgi:hypothetical protein
VRISSFNGDPKDGITGQRNTWRQPSVGGAAVASIVPPSPRPWVLFRTLSPEVCHPRPR